jgi:hypothetical protein
MNKYIKDFISIKAILQADYESCDDLKRELKPLILKLNNPTYYSKHLYKHPAEKFGYPVDAINTNIFTKFTNECIKIMNECQDIFAMQKLLQVEYVWTSSYSTENWIK